MNNLEINRNIKLYRLFEMLPGLLTWGAIIIPIILSLYYPILIASLMIVYAIYWLVKSFRMSSHLIIGYFNYKKDIKIDWLAECNKIASKKFSDIYHVVIMAYVNEEIETMDESIRALANSNFPSKNIIFILATEQRAGEPAQIRANILQNKYGGIFKDFIITRHPVDLPGEIRGKGSNITWAAKNSLDKIKKMHIPLENIIVTTLDSDNRVHKQFLAALTYKYLIDPDPIHSAYQPIAMFFNNIWDVPLVIRSISVGSSFWQMIESTRPYRLRNFSAHSQTLEGLIKTDFWSVRSIVEDGHQFWRSYLAFDGNYHVVPISVPVYQDAVLSPKGYLNTFREQYLQKRRWAWGCSDIPYVATRIIANKKIASDKWVQLARLVEGHFSWATTSIILAVVGWMPRIVNPGFSNSVMAFNFPLIYSKILGIAMIGMLITITISFLILPPKPKKYLTLSLIIEWIITPFMLPLSNIIFSSLPSIDSQTRLLFGRYLDYRVTEKAVTSSSNK